MTTDFSNFKYAESFISYFKKFSETNHLFLPEFETAKQVVEIMKKTKHTNEDFHNIEESMALIEEQKHYDGTGWHGFKNAVKFWLEANKKNNEKNV